MHDGGDDSRSNHVQDNLDYGGQFLPHALVSNIYEKL